MATSRWRGPQKSVLSISRASSLATILLTPPKTPRFGVHRNRSVFLEWRLGKSLLATSVDGGAR